jgi:hypothetical protein
VDALDVVLAVEQDDDGRWTDEEILEGIREHKDTLRNLQGSWGRLIARLEEEGEI